MIANAIDAAYARGLRDAAGVADDYRENAGGSESYRQACRHISERLAAAILKLEKTDV
jgi:hypothetical protein